MDSARDVEAEADGMGMGDERPMVLPDVDTVAHRDSHKGEDEEQSCQADVHADNLPVDQIEVGQLVGHRNEECVAARVASSHQT